MRFSRQEYWNGLPFQCPLCERESTSRSVMSNSVRPHRQQPTRLLHPWDSPGKNTGMDCHFLQQCMKVKSESEVVQLCPTLCDPVDCSLPGFCIHGILQARILGGLPSPPPWDLPNSGIKTASPAIPALQADSLLLSHQGSPEESP